MFYMTTTLNLITNIIEIKSHEKTQTHILVFNDFTTYYFLHEPPLIYTFYTNILYNACYSV